MIRTEYEVLPTAELVRRIRVAMSEGCIRPVHVYDMVGALLSRLEGSARDEAAMREALSALQARFERNVMAYQDRYFKFSGWHWTKKAKEAERWRDVFSELNEQCKAALAKPPRNCDRFHTGDVKADAQAAMEAILAEGVAGYRGIAEYLLSPVAGKRKTEKQPELPRPATDEEVEAGDAQWCKACRTECELRGKDALVHGCARHNPERALS